MSYWFVGGLSWRWFGEELLCEKVSTFGVVLSRDVGREGVDRDTLGVTRYSCKSGLWVSCKTKDCSRV